MQSNNQTVMNKDKQIERLQKQLDEARNEAKAIRKENGLLKRKLDKTSKKKEATRAALTKAQEQFLLTILNDIHTPDS